MDICKQVFTRRGVGLGHVPDKFLNLFTLSPALFEVCSARFFESINAVLMSYKKYSVALLTTN